MVSSPSCAAAPRRASPAISPPSSSTSTGFIHPNPRIEARILSRSASLSSLGLFSYGFNRSIGQRSTWSAGQGRVRPAPAGSYCVDNIFHLHNGRCFSALRRAEDLRPAASVKQCHMLFLAGGFIRRFPYPSTRSRTVLAASSLARGIQSHPCLLKSFAVGVGHLGHAPPLCLEFGERRLSGHDLSQMAQDRHASRGCFCVSRRPYAYRN